ncbi:MAG: AmmeMemoRadiSam system protein A [Campylobacterales bacterium]|nr:AmmeMemoRadiSam system protein A [Campylobacterales bacterium]
MHDIVIGLAKAAILAALHQDTHFDLQKALKTYPQLNEKKASFVTIRTYPQNQLRGCIGSLEAHRALYKDIISNAQSAALRDPRFTPLSLEELPRIKVEISILSTPEMISYQNIEMLRSKINPFKDGVILEYKRHSATYLPQVWEELRTFDLFFKSLCQKAELDSECLKKHPHIYTYQVTSYKEK